MDKYCEIGLNAGSHRNILEIIFCCCCWRDWESSHCNTSECGLKALHSVVGFMERFKGAASEKIE